MEVNARPQQVACRRYKLMDDMTIDDVDSLHVQRIILNDS
jgi:hypothetical protein